jgi:hypothetical protein
MPRMCPTRAKRGLLGPVPPALSEIRFSPTISRQCDRSGFPQEGFPCPTGARIIEFPLMPRLHWNVAILIFVSCLLSACPAKTHNDEVVLAIPEGFRGQVQVQLGVGGAAPLNRAGGAFVLTIPPDGKISTSTVLTGVPRVRTSDTSQVWGYTISIYKTGDGLAVGGNLEFFIGTKEQYDAYEAKKPKSEEMPGAPSNRPECHHIVLS